MGLKPWGPFGRSRGRSASKEVRRTSTFSSTASSQPEEQQTPLFSHPYRLWNDRALTATGPDALSLPPIPIILYIIYLIGHIRIPIPVDVPDKIVAQRCW